MCVVIIFFPSLEGIVLDPSWCSQHFWCFRTILWAKIILIGSWFGLERSTSRPCKKIYIYVNEKIITRNKPKHVNWLSQALQYETAPSLGLGVRCPHPPLLRHRALHGSPPGTFTAVVEAGITAKVIEMTHLPPVSGWPADLKLQGACPCTVMSAFSAIPMRKGSGSNAGDLYQISKYVASML